MPTLTIKGALNGYTSPFEAQLCWYYYQNAIYMPQVIVSGASVDIDNLFKVHLSHSNGLVNIRLDFGSNAYIPRLTVTALKERSYGGGLAIYQDWTSEPYSTVISGEVQARRVAVLTTANVSNAALDFARTGALSSNAVTGLGDALADKAPLAHSHGISQVNGLLDALQAVSGLNQGAIDQDPDKATSQVILTNHPNVPIPGFYWHITTTFFRHIAPHSNRSQIAVQYDGGSAIFVRSVYTDLGGWTKWERLDNQVAPGTIVYFPSYSAPPGYLKANGAQVNRVTYAKLFTAIGTFGGAGDGSTTFHLPDLRGEFIRCYDDARGVDINRALGSVQFGQNATHAHTGYAALSGEHYHAISGLTSSGGSHSHNISMGGNDVAGYRPPITAPGANGEWTAGAISAAGDHTHTLTGTAANAGGHTHQLVINTDGGSEARPRNMALLACIKY
ncbi:hypothetical protein EXN22_07640 [Pseudomonas tructae]|uniref:Phage tail collar domain-containing protein n=2 Tax=Pseudomonas tructae TaxID=2518644 RepID=A0A411MQE7_9PSED|nr:hypothetical protein EXN22_07640 [Pseudomonas tructae]